MFEFIGKEKENASLHITVHSGEVEVKIQSLKIGEASLNDVFDVKE
ncbi:MAG: hypothetical protein LBD17_01550 [Endomicrobium sp.]|nr:hypothetical protein [Endomicrobium sp.]